MGNKDNNETCDSNGGCLGHRAKRKERRIDNMLDDSDQSSFHDSDLDLNWCELIRNKFRKKKRDKKEAKKLQTPSTTDIKPQPAEKSAEMPTPSAPPKKEVKDAKVQPKPQPSAPVSVPAPVPAPAQPPPPPEPEPAVKADPDKPRESKKKPFGIVESTTATPQPTESSGTAAEDSSAMATSGALSEDMNQDKKPFGLPGPAEEEKLRKEEEEKERIRKEAEARELEEKRKAEAEEKLRKEEEEKERIRKEAEARELEEKRKVEEERLRKEEEEKERIRKEAEARELEEKRKVEEERLRKEEEEKERIRKEAEARELEEKRKAEEKEMQLKEEEEKERTKRESEAQKLEDKRKSEEERLQKEQEENERLRKEAEARELEEKRKADEEKLKAEEEKRKADEEKRKADEEKLRKEQEEEAARLLEEKRKAEELERQKAEEAKQLKENEEKEKAEKAERERIERETESCVEEKRSEEENSAAAICDSLETNVAKSEKESKNLEVGKESHALSSTSSGGMGKLNNMAGITDLPRDSLVKSKLQSDDKDGDAKSAPSESALESSDDQYKSEFEKASAAQDHSRKAAAESMDEVKTSKSEKDIMVHSSIPSGGIDGQSKPTDAEVKHKGEEMKSEVGTDLSDSSISSAGQRKAVAGMAGAPQLYSLNSKPKIKEEPISSEEMAEETLDPNFKIKPDLRDSLELKKFSDLKKELSGFVPDPNSQVKEEKRETTLQLSRIDMKKEQQAGKISPLIDDTTKEPIPGERVDRSLQTELTHIGAQKVEPADEKLTADRINRNVQTEPFIPADSVSSMAVGKIKKEMCTTAVQTDPFRFPFEESFATMSFVTSNSNITVTENQGIQTECVCNYDSSTERMNLIAEQCAARTGSSKRHRTAQTDICLCNYESSSDED